MKTDSKHPVFTIHSISENGASRELTFIARTLSVRLMDRLAKIDSDIPSPRKRAKQLYDVFKRFKFAAEKAGKPFVEFVAEQAKDNPYTPQIISIFVDNLTLEDVEDEFMQHSNTILTAANRLRVELLRTVADRTKMTPQSVALLDSAFDSPVAKVVLDANGEPQLDEDGNPKFEEVEVDNSFWMEADCEELAEAADYFRGRIKL